MNAYQIPKLTQTPTIDGHWQKMPWLEILALNIDHYAGAKPLHVPNVQAKLAYDDAALYVIFHVEDRFVRATAQNFQDDVFKDSCVELFFTPSEETSQGYFNLEINCGGTVLFHHQNGRHENNIPVSEADFKKLKIAHTAPKFIDPEIKEPVTWVIEYRLPINILANYTKVETPTPGVVWRANLYKCADESSHPHWLTWTPMDLPTPDFHRSCLENLYLSRKPVAQVK